MAYIQRSLEKIVEQVTQEYLVVLVTGPDRSAKRPCCKNLWKELPGAMYRWRI